jgi:hypothetical protein
VNHASNETQKLYVVGKYRNETQWKNSHTIRKTQNVIAGQYSLRYVDSSL